MQLFGGLRLFIHHDGCTVMGNGARIVILMMVCRMGIRNENERQLHGGCLGNGGCARTGNQDITTAIKITHIVKKRTHIVRHRQRFIGAMHPIHILTPRLMQHGNCLFVWQLSDGGRHDVGESVCSLGASQHANGEG